MFEDLRAYVWMISQSKFADIGRRSREYHHPEKGWIPRTAFKQ